MVGEVKVCVHERVQMSQSQREREGARGRQSAYSRMAVKSLVVAMGATYEVLSDGIDRPSAAKMTTAQL
jgi:hypothetical protein